MSKDKPCRQKTRVRMVPSCLSSAHEREFLHYSSQQEKPLRRENKTQVKANSDAHRNQLLNQLLSY